MNSENHLKSIILRLADALERDEDLDIDSALVFIAKAKASVKSSYEEYQRQSPPEAKLATKCFQDATTLFYGALGRLEEYTETCEELLLEKARVEVEQADKLLESALDWAESIVEQENPEGLY